MADTMSPTGSPGGASSSGDRLRTGIRRLNKWPILIFGGVALLFVLVVASILIDRSAVKPSTEGLTGPKGQSSLDMANRIAGNHTGGEIAATGAPPPVLLPPATPPLVDANGVPIAAVPVDPNAPPMPPGGSAGNVGPPAMSPAMQARVDMRSRIRDIKQSEFAEAVKAPTNIRMVAARSSGSPPSDGDASTEQRLAAVRQQIAAAAAQGQGPSAADMATLAALQSGGGGGAGGGGNGPAGGQNANDVGQFGNRTANDRWRLASQPEAPHSKYELRAGFVIPGTLISGINSQLPGQIVAQISQNVFDTATGKYLLFPQGSRLVGTYSASVQFGQSRILVAWQRIVFPDGKAMDIDAMPGSTSAGYAGLKDQVNNHYIRTFASALFMSAIVAGIDLSQRQPTTTATVLTPGQAATQALGQELGETTSQLIQKNLSIAPTLTIRPGFRFNIMVTKDMTLSKPYRAFDY